jgi:hypothetical protein
MGSYAFDLSIVVWAVSPFVSQFEGGVRGYYLTGLSLTMPRDCREQSDQCANKTDCQRRP